MRKLWALAGVAIAVLIVVGAVVSRAHQYVDVNLAWYALLVQPLNALSTVFVALRIALLGRPDIKPWDGAKAAALTATFLYLLPSRLSELVKPIYLAQRSGAPIARMISIVAVERWTDLLVLAATVAVAAGLSVGGPLGAAAPSMLTLAGLAFAGFLLFLWRPQWFEAIAARAPHRLLRNALGSLFSHARSIATPGAVAGGLALGAAAWICSLATTYAYLNLAGGRELGLDACLVVFLAGTLGLIVGVAPGGLGTYEASVALALKLYGFPFGQGLALAVGLRLASLGFLGVLSLYVVSREHIGFSGLRARVEAFLRTPPSASAS